MALILARKHLESVHIGEHIVVRVMRDRGQIKLWIDAPKELTILRSELVGQPRHTGEWVPVR